MSKAEVIALVCVLCLVPLWAVSSIIMFALGTVRCGRLIDPYYESGGSGGESGHGQCPMGPHNPPDDRGVEGPGDPRTGRHEADWWPQFERDLGRYVEAKESCPSGRAGTSTEPATGASETPTRA